MSGALTLARQGLRVASKLLAGLILLLLLVLAACRIAAARRETETRPPPGVTMIATPTGRVAAAVTGPANGPPILLVHGTAAWSGFWKDVAAHLAAGRWRVIAIDLPPFGWSDRDPAGRYGRIAQAERLSAVLGAVAAGRPAVVLGHSFGAGAATELALRHPGQLRSLVLVDAALGKLDPEGGDPLPARLFRLAPVAQAATSALITNPAMTGRLLRSLIARKEQAAPWLATLQAPMRREGSTAAYARWLPSLFETDDGALSRRSAALAGIKVPVALIWGEADTVTPLVQGRRIAALTRARSFALLPGTGHIPHIEDPAGFLAALDSALAPDREGR
jgi:pimeloyl-ACP methyl ester carboxylesterase